MTTTLSHGLTVLKGEIDNKQTNINKKTSRWVKGCAESYNGGR